MTAFYFHRDTVRPFPPLFSIPTAVLALLSAALVNSSFRAGGLSLVGWSVSLVLIAVSGLLFWLKTAPWDLAPRLTKRFFQLFTVLIGLIVLQIVPLPLIVIQWVSAAQRRALDPLMQVMPGAWFGTLSLAPLLTISHLADLIAYAAVLLLARELAWRMQRRVWVAASPILVLGAFQAVLGWAQYAADPAHAVARGTYLNRNHFAGFLEMCLPFAILYAWDIIARHRHGRQSFSIMSAIKVSGLVFVAAAILVAELRSLSRLGSVSTLVSVAIVIALALPSSWSRLSRLGGFLSLLAAVIMTMILLAPDRVFVRFAGAPAAEDGGVYDVRQLIWRDTVRMAADYPAIGVGFGAFASAFPFYQRELPNARIGYAHNDYLQWLAELGFPGAIVLVALLVLFLSDALRASVPRVSTNPNTRRFALACTGALAALMVHSVGDYNLCVPTNAMTFAWIAGLATGIDPRVRLIQRQLTSGVSATSSTDGRPIAVTIIHPRS